MTAALQVLLGFDFGMKHIGTAVGQTITKTARPLGSLKAIQGIPVWSEVDTLITTWQPQALVVGIPLNMDGSEQSITHAAQTFAESLQARYQIAVHTIDERLTTVNAREQLFSEGGYRALTKNRIDSYSAQIILQAWFNQDNLSDQAMGKEQ